LQEVYCNYQEENIIQKGQINMDNIYINVQDVNFEYEKGARTLEHISFNAVKGSSIGIAGANGAGKSTLLKLLVGLQPDFTGSIQVMDIALSARTLAQIRAKTGLVFQEPDSQLFMPSVYEDVAFAPVNYGLPEDEIKKRVDNALNMTGISHLKDKQIYKLSGGEKKLVSIASILSMKPDIILMDEPSIALDPKNRRRLINIINSLQCLKIIASHDLDMLWDTCSRIILMAEGHIVKDAPAKEILSDKKLLEENNLELPLRLQG